MLDFETNILTYLELSAPTGLVQVLSPLPFPKFSLITPLATFLHNKQIASTQTLQHPPELKPLTLNMVATH
jgi:hypothetical protein